mmetsp:Transcript_8012/g.12877  ORF Transcript_8012/g.12877 Transcript_8012/m.12877 type:complete len:605 (+) Transcript_8012:136-1950(+)
MNSTFQWASSPLYTNSFRKKATSTLKNKEPEVTSLVVALQTEQEVKNRVLLENASLTERIAKGDRQGQLLVDKVNDIEKRLKEREVAIWEMEGLLKKRTKQATVLKDRLSDAANQIAQAERNNQALSKAFKEVDVTLERERDERRRADSELTRAVDELQRMRSESKYAREMMQERAAILEELRNSDDALRRLREQYAASEQNRADLSRNIESLTLKLGARDESIAHLRGEVEDLRHRKQEREDMLMNLQRELAEKTMKIEIEEAAKGQWRQQADLVSAQLREEERKVQFATDQTQFLIGRIQAMEETESRNADKLHLLEERERQLVTMKQQLEDERGRQKEFERRLQDALRQLNETHAQLSAHDEENNSLSITIQSLQEEKEQLSQQLRRVKQEAARESGAVEEEVGIIKKRVVALASQLQAEQKNRVKAEERASEMEGKVNNLLATIESESKSKRTLEAEADRIRKEAARLSKRLEEQEEETDRLSREMKRAENLRERERSRAVAAPVIETVIKPSTPIPDGSSFLSAPAGQPQTPTPTRLSAPPPHSPSLRNITLSSPSFRNSLTTSFRKADLSIDASPELKSNMDVRLKELKGILDDAIAS